MKKLSSTGAIRAFTLVELLVVIAIITVVVVFITPKFNTRHSESLTIMCMNNLRQNDSGFIMWAGDNQDQFPWQVSVTNGGSMESIAAGHVFPHFQTLSNYVENLSALVCPTDKAKTIATGYEELSDTNISYFINPDATTNSPLSLTILAGDRHLQANGQPVKPGLFTFATNLTMGWTLELHSNNKIAPVGVLAFADGDVEVAVTKSLTALFQRQEFATNRLAVP